MLRAANRNNNVTMLFRISAFQVPKKFDLGMRATFTSIMVKLVAMVGNSCPYKMVIIGQGVAGTLALATTPRDLTVQNLGLNGL